jgi:site-specific DNA-methyltransferase (adenine-specific)
MLNLKLAANDATSEALLHLQEVNAHYREQPWPAPYNETHHELRLGDARKLGWIKKESIDLVVTSPPYFTLKEYVHTEGQMGDIINYEAFLRELDKVWKQCYRVLKPGGRICCVVGDVCIPRKQGGRHYVLPLHSDIQVRARKIGFDVLTPILWSKIANGVTEAEGNGAGFYGKPYQPGAIVKNDVEYILFLRKGTQYRSPEPMQKALSMLTKDEMRTWLVSFWSDIRGASTRDGHPAPFPVAVAERLIKLFSFAGDTILDPFVGTGSTILAALETGRSSIGCDIEPRYLEFADARIRKSASRARFAGATAIAYNRNIKPGRVR